MERILTDDGLFAAGNPAAGVPGTMVTSVWLNNVQEEIANVIEDAEIELDGASRSQMLDAMKLIAVKTVGLAVVSTTPSVQGPPLVFVLDRWHWATWVETAFYTGYRSLNCGDWYIGSMTGHARPHEIDGTGAIFDIADEPSLWGWAQEEGYVVDPGDWEPKWTMYAPIGTTQFRGPDYRDLFPRVEGTDVDTANPRLRGSFQNGAPPDHRHVSPTNDSGMSDTIQAARGATWPYGALQIGVANTMSASAIQVVSGEDSWLLTGSPVSLGGDGRPINGSVAARIFS